MTHDRKARKTIGFRAQNLSRILIASYFMAVSLGLIAGTDGTTLVHWITPAAMAAPLAAALIFGLAFLVMTGIWLRPAALLLAIILFWSSYIALIDHTSAVALDTFWRDLALIGALFLTYAQSSRRATRMRAVIRRKLPVRKLSVDSKTRSRRAALPAATTPPEPAQPEVQFASRRRVEPRDTSTTGAEDENIFANIYPIQASA